MLGEYFRDFLRPVLAKTGTKGRDFIRLIEAFKYMDLRVWDQEWGNQRIHEALISGKPHAIGKIGSAELFALRRYFRYHNFKNASELTARDRKILGLYPDNFEIYEQYSRMMIDAVLPELTIIGVWFNLGEASIIKKYSRNARKIPTDSLESYIFKNDPWTKALEGKNVLVISPFVKSIEKQYSRRREIWGGQENILPQFNLSLMKAPFSISLVPPAYENWFSGLEDLKSQMSANQFDVALIGASVYSLPLTVHAKKLGKQGIHMGGALQIYFGIKGNRWENNPIISSFYNDCWIRPLPEETPMNVSLIEGGAYW